MPKPIITPILEDITTNPRYPAYKTEKDTVIQLNGTETDLPTGATLAALVKFVDGCGLKTVIMTGGAEPEGHSKNSFHGKNLAIDIAGKKYNKLTHAQVLTCAKQAGFTHGTYEDFRGTKKDHWHLQIGIGNGLGGSQSLQNAELYIKKF